MLNRLRIVGTNHISKESVQEIKKQFLDFKPNAIAIELDQQRLHSLLHPQKQSISLGLIRQIGVKGLLFSLIARYVQQKLGKLVGMKPGSDMLFAVQLSQNNDLLLHLIDRPINITVKRLMKLLTWKEKFRFIGDIFRGVIFKKISFQFLKSSKKKSPEKVPLFDIKKVPPKNLIKTLMGVLKKRYPTVYKVLIDERNKYMAKNLAILLKKFPEHKILVVVGAGHKEGLLEDITTFLQRIDIV